MTVDRTRKSWDAMWQRCTNPNSNRFAAYGARGIKVCPRWSSYGAFLADMGPRPSGMTLDRRDGTKGYSPLNCRWATPQEQARNRSDNLVITLEGKRRCLAEWSELTGIHYQTLWNRLNKHGWTPEEALTTPKQGGRRNG
jgi:hypothetical protein